MKKTFAILIIGGIGWIGWYLFIKSHDFRIHFTTKDIPGIIDQTIKIWELSLADSDVLKEETDFFTHRIKKNDRIFYFQWVLAPLTDSTTHVSVLVKEPANSVANRLKIPFTQTFVEQASENLVRNLIEDLKEHAKWTKINVVGLSHIKEKFCICVALKTPQMGKAQGMMKHYNFLSYFIASNEMITDGVPVIEITNWNRQEDSLYYNFCYPIVAQDSIPSDSTLFYRHIPSQKALKAIYNGNYITSDRAWYALLAYAEKYDCEVIGEPIEFFYDNPNFGGNELEWTTEIFLPVK